MTRRMSLARSQALPKVPLTLPYQFRILSLAPQAGNAPRHVTSSHLLGQDVNIKLVIIIGLSPESAALSILTCTDLRDFKVGILAAMSASKPRYFSLRPPAHASLGTSTCQPRSARDEVVFSRIRDKDLHTVEFRGRAFPQPFLDPSIMQRKRDAAAAIEKAAQRGSTERG